mgnify:CR=1 FL=1
MSEAPTTIEHTLPPHSVADTLAALAASPASTHPPRVLILYGSLRDQSFSRYLAEEYLPDARADHGVLAAFTTDGAPVSPTAPELVVVARVPSAEDCGREHIEAGAPDVEGPPVEVPEVEGGALPA